MPYEVGTLLKKMNHLAGFTENEKGVIQWILEHPSETANMTVTQLAAASYSSSTTVMRVTQKLGCDGFRDFKLKFVKEIESEKFVQKHVNFTTPFEITDNTAMIVSSMASLFKESVDVVNASLDPRQLTRTAEIIQKSSRLFFYAVGDSGITCKSFMNKLIKIGRYAFFADENGDHNAVTATTTENDCAFFVSYSGIEDFFPACIHGLKNNGTKIITMTSNPDSIIARAADECILLPDLEDDHKYATFYSQQAFSYVLNILYAVLYAQSLKHKK